MIICLPMTTQAAETTLTLACQGTAAQVDLQQLEANPHNWKPITKPEPVSGGLTVDLTTGEVAFAGLAPIKVKRVNDAVIEFGGQKRQGVGWFLTGTSYRRILVTEGIRRQRFELAI
jgi:hypothetical protein